MVDTVKESCFPLHVQEAEQEEKEWHKVQIIPQEHPVRNIVYHELSVQTEIPIMPNQNKLNSKISRFHRTPLPLVAPEGNQETVNVTSGEGERGGKTTC